MLSEYPAQNLAKISHKFYILPCPLDINSVHVNGPVQTESSAGSVNKEISRVFPTLALDLAELEEFDKVILLHKESGIDYPWMDKMFFNAIHGTDQYSWIVKMFCSTIHV